MSGKNFRFHSQNSFRSFIRSNPFLFILSHSFSLILAVIFIHNPLPVCLSLILYRHHHDHYFFFIQCNDPAGIRPLIRLHSSFGASFEPCHQIPGTKSRMKASHEREEREEDINPIPSRFILLLLITVSLHFLSE